MSPFETEVLELLEWFQTMLTALFFLVGIGVGGLTWISVLYAKNSTRFW